MAKISSGMIQNKEFQKPFEDWDFQSFNARISDNNLRTFEILHTIKQTLSVTTKDFNMVLKSHQFRNTSESI